MDKKGLMLVLITAIVSGFSIFVNSFGVKEGNSYIFTFLKNVIVAVFLFAVILLLGNLRELKKLTKKQWHYLVLIGLIGGSIPFLLFFKGLQMTLAATGSFIQKTMFIYVAIMAVIFLKEKLDKKIIFAAILLLIGNVLLLKFAFNWNFGIGDLLILIATLFWAVENVISKYALSKLDMNPNILAFGRMFFGSLFILVFLLATSQLNAVTALSSVQLMWILISVPFLLIYLLTWYNGLKTIKVTVATSILLLGSVVTSLLSFAFAGKSLTILQALGILLLVSGISLMLAVEFRRPVKNAHYQ